MSLKNFDMLIASDFIFYYGSEFSDFVKALITGFEPFGGDRFNPSELVARRLREILTIQRLEIVTSVLLVSFRRAGSSLIDLLRSIRPNIYIGLGLWPGIPYVTIERVAINAKDARVPDNDGEKPIDEPIELEDSPAYFATLPKKAILKRLREIVYQRQSLTPWGRFSATL